MDNGKILVADDDREIAAAIEKLLVREGYEVIKAYNGMEAWMFWYPIKST